MSLRKSDSQIGHRPYLVIYFSLHLSFCAYSLYEAIHLYDPRETARATLRLLSAFSLLPILYKPTTDSPTQRRWPVVITFLISLALLIDAVLRVLDAGDAFLEGPPKREVIKPINIIIIHLLLHITAALSLRHVTSKQSILVPKFVQFMLPNRHCISDHNMSPENTAIHLHAVSAALARLVDLLFVITKSFLLSSLLDIIAASITAIAAFPLLKSSVKILIHAVPPSLVEKLMEKRDEVSQIDGVLSCGNIHVWEETHGRFIGTLCVTVDTTVSKDEIMRRIMSLLNGLTHDFTLQVDTWEDGPIQRLEVSIPK